MKIIMQKIIPMILFWLSGFVIGLYASGVKDASIFQYGMTILAGLFFASIIIDESN